ncbi:MAG: TlpA family protein disulfide reductase [Rhodothermales bacterium]|nr:TlpA family protein disulfide reductase [Rhodothermales bacterium]
MARLSIPLLIIGMLHVPVAAIAQTEHPEIVVATAQEILESVGSNSTPYTLVNIWATWCSPCVEEFPEIVRLANQMGEDSLSVVFVSLDFVDDMDLVRAFLVDQSWARQSYIEAGSADFVNDFIPEWTGTVPSSFIFDMSGTLIWQKEGKTTFPELISAFAARE